MLKTVIPAVLRLGFLTLVMAWLWSGATLFLSGVEQDLARAGILLLAGALTGIMLLGGRYGYWTTLGLSYMLVAASLPGLSPWGGAHRDPLRLVLVDLPEPTYRVASAPQGQPAGFGTISGVTFLRAQAGATPMADLAALYGLSVGKSNFSPLSFSLGSEVQ